MDANIVVVVQDGVVIDVLRDGVAENIIIKIIDLDDYDEDNLVEYAMYEDSDSFK